MTQECFRNGSQSRQNQTIWVQIALCTLFLVACTWPVSVSQAQSSDDVLEQSFEYGPDVTVRVDNPSGKISVEVWGEDLVHIVATKSGGGANRSLQSDVAIMRTRSTVSVNCSTSKDSKQIDLKIYIPRRSHLRLQSASGTVEILGPIASATAETQTGDILLESPSSQDAELSLHSANGTVNSSLSFSLCDVNNNHHLQGKLGQGGAPIVLRSLNGNITAQPLRPQLALLVTRNPSALNQSNSVSDSPPVNLSSDPPTRISSDPPMRTSTDPGGRTSSPGQPPRPSTIWPDPDPSQPPPGTNQKKGNSGYNDVFGMGQNTQGSNQSVDSNSRRTQTTDSNLDTSGGMRIRIIPPPTSPGSANTPAADDTLGNNNSSSNSKNGSYPDSNGTSRPGSLHGRSSTTAADDVLSSLPKKDPAAGGPTPPHIVRRGDDGSPPPSSGNSNSADDDSTDAIKLDTKLVNLNVNVSNRSGRSMTDLKQGNFTIYEDDVKQEVAHFRPVATPFNLVLLLDLSGSTRDKIDSIKQTALKFINATNPQDKVAVVTFTRGVRVVCRPTNDRELLKQRIKDMQRTDGGTAFYEAMWFVLVDVLRDFQGERNAIVVMTDGVDNALSAAYPAPSRVSFKQMIDKILESGTLVYPIYLDTEAENYQQQWGETPEVYAQARTQLQQLADASGGVLFMAPRVEDLGNIYEKVAAELRTIYSLGYYPASFERDGKWHKIKVKVNQDDVVIRTRRGYYAK